MRRRVYVASIIDCNSIAQQELAVARKPLHRRRQPQYETIVRLQRCPREPGVIRSILANGSSIRLMHHIGSRLAPVR